MLKSAMAAQGYLHQVIQDMRYAARSWSKRPVLTVIVVLSLALGIAANTAIFSIVDALLLKDLPYRDADRLMYVTEYWPHEPIVAGSPGPDLANWRAHSRLADAMGGYGGGAAVTLTGRGEPERVHGTAVTASLLPMIGARMELGRTFTAEEGRPGGPRAVILGYRLWQRRFGGSREAVGERVELDGIDRTIVGVLPASFRFPDNHFEEELLLPMALPADSNWRDAGNFRILRVMMRVKPGVTARALRSELDALVKATGPEEPPQFHTMRKDMEIRVSTLRDWLTGGVRTFVLALLGAVAAVLLIACLNIASLQVAVAIGRRKEMALRAAIGAGASRLMRQLLAESVSLSLLSGCLGIALAYLSLNALRTFLPANLHLADRIALDSRVLMFSLALTILTGIVTGLIPAFSSSRVPVNDVLKQGENRSSGGRREKFAHGSLIAVEVAVAIALLSSSGLLIRAFVRLASADPGFDPRGVLTLKIAPSEQRYPNPADRVRLYGQILEKARAIPGIRFAAMSGGLPVTGAPVASGVAFEGRPEPPPGGRPAIPITPVSTDYFRALSIPVLRGRTFSDADGSAVAVVNQAFAERFFPGEDALEKRIEIGSHIGHWREIIGIVGDVKQEGGRPIDPLSVYTPLGSFESGMFLVLKSSGSAGNYAAAGARAVHSVDPNEPVFDIAKMETTLNGSLAPARSTMTLMTLFAGFALLLASVGVFGVMAYTVNRQRREIGIRIALGASRGDVLRMIAGRGMRVVAIGIALGMGAVAALGRTLASLMEGLKIKDPAILAMVTGAFLCVALAACLIPARWAARIDPAVALRQE